MNASTNDNSDACSNFISFGNQNQKSQGSFESSKASSWNAGPLPRPNTLEAPKINITFPELKPAATVNSASYISFEPKKSSSEKIEPNRNNQNNFSNFVNFSVPSDEPQK
jgi:hypothetical protein